MKTIDLFVGGFLSIVLGVVGIFGMHLAFGQAPPAPAPQTAAAAEFKLSENQQLRLTVKQQAVVIAFAPYQQAQQNFEKAKQELMEESEKIKKENKWDPKLQFNMQTLEFQAPPPPETTVTPKTAPAVTPTDPPPAKP